MCFMDKGKHTSHQCFDCENQHKPGTPYPELYWCGLCDTHETTCCWTERFDFRRLVNEAATIQKTR